LEHLTAMLLLLLERISKSFHAYPTPQSAVYM
jgi:hypothetical protein